MMRIQNSAKAAEKKYNYERTGKCSGYTLWVCILKVKVKVSEFTLAAEERLKIFLLRLPMMMKAIR